MYAQSEARRRAESIDEFMNSVESVPEPEVQQLLRELVQSLMAFHGSAIERMLEITRDSREAGDKLIDEFGRDERVGNLLLLYGAHPQDLRTRVEEAIKDSRPYVRSLGGDVELLDVSDPGSVTLRLVGNWGTDATTAAELRSAIEERIYNGVADVTLVSFEKVPSALASVE